MLGFKRKPFCGLVWLALDVLLLALPASSDIPVHCKARQVGGAWRIQLTRPETTRSACQHLRPDLVERQPNSSAMASLLSVHRELRLDVANGVMDHGGSVFVAGSEGKVGAMGNWTMVADEGFEVEFDHDVLNLADSNAGRLNLFAFSRYDLHDPNGNSATPGDKPIVAAGMDDWEKHSVSRCDETLLGWYSIGRERWGCWKGQRKSKSVVRTMLISVAEHAGAERPLTLTELSDRAERINARKGSWRAHAYKRWAGKTTSELARLRGVRWHHREMSYPKSFLSRRVALVNTSTGLRKTDAAHAIKTNDSSALSAEDRYYFTGLADAESKLPKSVDWTNTPDGLNFLEPVADQADCGSCWAVAGMRMLTTRHKIAQKDPDALPWSITFPLYCSEYNQGCDGGYGFLIAKWSQDVGLVPATCARYTTKGSCNVDKACVAGLNNGTRWRASNYRYMGVDNRAKTTTAAMLMRELHEHGPIVVGLSGGDIGDEFMLYAGGIYSGETIPPANQNGGHAVLLVGYGEEDGEKYWTVQNSWGPDWGEEGYVRLSRDKIKFRTGEIADVVPDEQKGRQVDRVISGAQ